MSKEFDDLMKKAEEEGWKRGLMMGWAEMEREIVANAMAMDAPMELVATLMKLPVDAVKQIAAQCKAEAVASL